MLAVVGLVVVMAKPRLDKSAPSAESSRGLVAVMYKSPSCTCCLQYASYLKKLGYGVHIEGIEDMSEIKSRFGVPYELESCHTMELEGYIIEGHVPEEAIQKLLTERPDIKGIGLAGMPSGSPGMPGSKTASFVIYEITRDGTKGEVFMTI